MRLILGDLVYRLDAPSEFPDEKFWLVHDEQGTVWWSDRRAFGVLNHELTENGQSPSIPATYMRGQALAESGTGTYAPAEEWHRTRDPHAQSEILRYRDKYTEAPGDAVQLRPHGDLIGTFDKGGQLRGTYHPAHVEALTTPDTTWDVCQSHSASKTGQVINTLRATTHGYFSGIALHWWS